jgi:polysaccharide biosynthesis protein PslG
VRWSGCRGARRRAHVLATCVGWGVVLLAACSPAGTPAKSPAPSGREHTKPISFAILEDYDKGADLAGVARDFALFRELGVPVWRGSFGWDDYETKPGQFDLDWLERFVGLADSMGITLRPYLGYTPEWAARGGKDDQVWNDPPRRVSDWARFVSALATRLGSHRSLRSYEIYNEENVPLWWDGSARDYAVVLRRGSEAVRRADPDAQVLLGGMVWPDADWLETACDNGRGPFDLLPFHAYPETWTPDSVTVENYLGPGYREDFLEQADALCGRKAVWINEAGFATTPGKTERQQAEWWVRAFATFLAEPRVEHIGIYEIRDQRQGTAVIGDAPNYYLGLIRTDGTRKLAFETIKLLVRLFGADSITVADAELRVRVTQGKAARLYQHLFRRPDGRQLVFVWDRMGSPTVELELERPGSRVTAFELDGRGSQWGDTAGNSIRRVSLVPGQVRIFEVEP